MTPEATPHGAGARCWPTSACVLHINGKAEPLTGDMVIRFVALPNDCLQPVLYRGEQPVEGVVQLCLTIGDD